MLTYSKQLTGVEGFDQTMKLGFLKMQRMTLKGKLLFM